MTDIDIGVAGTATSGAAPSARTPGDLATLLPSWERSLRAENKSPSTITIYTSGASQFLTFLRAAGMPTEASAVRREHVEAFIEDHPGTAQLLDRSDPL